jgi:esterase/lipase
MKAGKVLMLHGAGGGAWEWNVWARVFDAAGWAVHAPELTPGAHGLEHTQLSYYRDQVRAAWQAMHAGAPQSCVAIGASLGGLLALDLGVEAGALVLINPMPPAPWHARLPTREPYPPVVPWARDASLANTARALPDADPATWRYAYRRWRDESGAVLNAARAGVTLAKPACTCLVIASAKDEDVPATLSADYAHDIGASYVELPGASHVGPLLGREAASVAEMCVGWLAKVFAQMHA